MALTKVTHSMITPAGYLYVEDFGASTSIANNAPAINAAIAAAYAANASVYLTDVYPTTAPIILTPVGGEPVSLYGADMYKSGIAYTGSGNAIEINQPGTTQQNQWTISNIKIDGTAGAGHGIYCNYTSIGVIQNCSIYNFDQSAIYYDNQCYTQIVNGCFLFNNGSLATYAAITVTGGHDNNAIRIENNVIYNASGQYKAYGVYVGNVATGVAIKNNVIEVFENGILFVGQGEITGNYIEGTNQSAISIENNVSVTGNWLNPQGTGATGNFGISINGNGNYVAGNTCTDTVQYGVNNISGYGNFVHVFEDSTAGQSTILNYPWAGNVITRQTLNSMLMAGNFAKTTKTYNVPADLTTGTLLNGTTNHLAIAGVFGSLVIINITSNASFNIDTVSTPAGTNYTVGVKNNSGGVMGDIFFIDNQTDSSYTKPANGKIRYADFVQYQMISSFTGDITF